MNMSLAQRFKSLVSDFDRCTADVLAVAEIAGSDSRRTWQALVAATVGDSAASLPLTGATGNSVNAAEVREVLMAVERHFGRRLAELEGALSAESYDVGSSLEELEDAMWTFRNRRLSDYVREQVAGYLRRVAPKPSVSGVFAAAASGMNKSPQVSRARGGDLSPLRVDMMLCNRCGAPRLEQVIYGSCAYCGEPFFPRATS